MTESTVIFWFSGTGNSLHVAREITELIPNTELLPVPTRGNVDISPETHLVLVSPVYSWAVPRVVQRFITRLPSQNISRVTVVLTHGAAPGGAAALAAREFSRTGISNVNVFTIRMVENYPPFGGAPKREKIDKFLAESEIKLENILKDIKEGNNHPPSLGSRILMVPSLLINALFQRTLPRSDRKFTVTDTCNGCGTCAAVCPVNNIYLAKGKPIWKGKCEQCFACFHWCPQRAILYGARTAKQARYHHPAVDQRHIQRKAPGD